jgi:hypothetical protein
LAQCDPISGAVDASTQLFCDGEPLADVTKVHVLPLYNSLPNRDKNISEAEIFERFLLPYFLGGTRFISKNEVVNIDGFVHFSHQLFIMISLLSSFYYFSIMLCGISVEFKVVAIEPECGLVTALTTIYAHGAPLTTQFLAQQQMQVYFHHFSLGFLCLSVSSCVTDCFRRVQEDAELARRLQAEESYPMGARPAMPGGTHSLYLCFLFFRMSVTQALDFTLILFILFPIIFPKFEYIFFSPVAPNMRALQEQLLALAQEMPPDHPQRLVFQRLHQRLAILLQQQANRGDGNAQVQNLETFLRFAASLSDAPRGGQPRREQVQVLLLLFYFQHYCCCLILGVLIVCVSECERG